MDKSFCNVFFEDGISLPYKDITVEKIETVIEKSLFNLYKTSISVSIIITSNRYIQKINKDYRDKDYPTDVISFPNEEDDFPQLDEEIRELGDIYISIERAEEQFEEYSNSFEEEMNRLLIHGILHLCGYDHERSPEDEAEMEKMERELMKSL